MNLEILRIYEGSDGEATKRLYTALEKEFGVVGIVAVNIFRAQKASARAKVYRGGIRGRGSYRGMAYDRKQWAMDNLCKVLKEHAESLGIVWGWKEDPAQQYHPWVLYVTLPTGQVSFHTGTRGAGPDYDGDWDGIRNVSPQRIVSWISQLMETKAKLNWGVNNLNQNEEGT